MNIKKQDRKYITYLITKGLDNIYSGKSRDKFEKKVIAVANKLLLELRGREYEIEPQGIRKEIKKIDGKRNKFTGTYVCTKSSGRWILLYNICDNEGNLLSDHMWMRKGSNIKKLDLNEGYILEFTARAGEYKKRTGKDFCLKRPTNVKIIGICNSRSEVFKRIKAWNNE